MSSSTFDYISFEGVKRNTIGNRRLLHRTQAAEHHKPDAADFFAIFLLIYWRSLSVLLISLLLLLSVALVP
jgi:hypothetical protein